MVLFGFGDYLYVVIFHVYSIVDFNENIIRHYNLSNIFTYRAIECNNIQKIKV